MHAFGDSRLIIHSHVNLGIILKLHDSKEQKQQFSKERSGTQKPHSSGQVLRRALALRWFHFFLYTFITFDTNV